jgi:drug/metabolite transporter (DMT)-like permease
MTWINDSYNTDRLTSVVGTLVRFPLAVTLLTGINFSLLYGFKTKELNLELKEQLTSSKYRIKGRSKSSWLWLLAGALIGTSLGLYLYTEAAYIAGAVTMALMTTAGPLFSILLDWLINKERISLYGLLGILITLGGVIMIVLI